MYKDGMLKSTPSPSLFHIISKVVFSVADPGSDLLHPGSRIKKAPDPGSGSAAKSLSIFNPKKLY
jgi:hypothetical protein